MAEKEILEQRDELRRLIAAALPGENKLYGWNGLDDFSVMGEDGRVYEFHGLYIWMLKEISRLRGVA